MFILGIFHKLLDSINPSYKVDAQGLTSCTKPSPRAVVFKSFSNLLEFTKNL